MFKSSLSFFRERLKIRTYVKEVDRSRFLVHDLVKMSVFFRCVVSGFWELALAIFKVTYGAGPTIILI